jgi:hypothetical protein
MLASFPACILNLTRAALGIPYDSFSSENALAGVESAEGIVFIDEDESFHPAIRIRKEPSFPGSLHSDEPSSFWFGRSRPRLAKRSQKSQTKECVRFFGDAGKDHAKTVMSV